MSQPKYPVSNAMLDRLRDEAAGYSDFVDVILDDPNSRYGGQDGRDTLIEILGLLIGLTGCEGDAIAWLFHSRGFTRVAKDDVCLSLEHGDFWTLDMLAAWLKVIDAHRDLCPHLIEAVFRDGCLSMREAP